MPLKRRLLMPLVAALLLVATSAEAQQWNLGLNTGAAVPIDMDLLRVGYGFDFYASYLHALDSGRLGLDLAGGYARFDGRGQTVEGPYMWRVALGPRYEFGESVRPGFFAHAGYASFRHQVRVPNDSADVVSVRDANATGIALDAGVYVEWQVATLLTLGIYGAYNQIYASSSDDTRWMSAGVRLSFLFDRARHVQIDDQATIAETFVHHADPRQRRAVRGDVVARFASQPSIQSNSGVVNAADTVDNTKLVAIAASSRSNCVAIK